MLGGLAAVGAGCAAGITEQERPLRRLRPWRRGSHERRYVAFTDDAVVNAGSLRWLLARPDESVTATTGMVLPLAMETTAQKRFEQYADFSKGTHQRCYDCGASSPSIGSYIPIGAACSAPATACFPTKHS